MCVCVNVSVSASVCVPVSVSVSIAASVFVSVSVSVAIGAQSHDKKSIAHNSVKHGSEARKSFPHPRFAVMSTEEPTQVLHTLSLKTMGCSYAGFNRKSNTMDAGKCRITSHPVDGQISKIGEVFGT